ncbi:unnamed protein product [Calypogeia fissa]
MSNNDVTKISFFDSDKLLGAINYMIWAFIVEQILREKKLWYVVDSDGTITIYPVRSHLERDNNLKSINRAIELGSTLLNS